MSATPITEIQPFDPQNTEHVSKRNAICEQKCLGIVGYPELAQLTLGDFLYLNSLEKDSNIAAAHIHHLLTTNILIHCTGSFDVAANENPEQAATRQIINQFNRAFFNEPMFPGLGTETFCKLDNKLQSTLDVFAKKDENNTLEKTLESHPELQDAFNRMYQHIKTTLAQRRHEAHLEMEGHGKTS